MKEVLKLLEILNKMIETDRCSFIKDCDMCPFSHTRTGLCEVDQTHNHISDYAKDWLSKNKNNIILMLENNIDDLLKK